MKKILFVMLCGMFMFSGCLIRTRIVEQPRVDLEVKGNRGCLGGKCEKVEAKPKKLSEKRLISVMEVELGRHGAKKKEKQEKSEETDISDADILSDADVYVPEEIEDAPKETYMKEQQPETDAQYTRIYVVRKGDTLQKISQRFYGTTKKYIMLYEDNKDTLKSLDDLRVGQKIKIP